MNVDAIKKDVPPQGNEGLGFITHSCDFVLLLYNNFGKAVTTWELEFYLRCHLVL